MNIQDVVDIHAICEHGSFRKAATALGISQPTLSARVLQLEKSLGVSLFHRQRGKSSPTHLAQFIAERSNHLLESAEHLSHRATSLARGQEGHLRIGFGPAATYILFPAIVRELQLRELDITLECISGATLHLVSALAKEQLDMVIGPYDENMEVRGIEVQALFEDEYVGAIHAKHPLAAGPVSDPKAPFQFPLALTELEPRYEKISRNEYMAVEDMQNLIICSDYSVLIGMAQDGRHITAGPRYVFMERIRAGNMVTYTPPLGKILHTEHCIKNTNSLTLPALERVIDIAHDVAKVISGDLRRNPTLGTLDEQ